MNIAWNIRVVVQEVIQNPRGNKVDATDVSLEWKSVFSSI